MTRGALLVPQLIFTVPTYVLVLLSEENYCAYLYLWSAMTDQRASQQEQTTQGISRRTLAVGAAWTVPAVAAAAAAPVRAVSLLKDPGINGWVLNTPRSTGDCSWTLEVNSRPSSPPATTDGAPFGLYIYDVEDPNVFSGAKLVYYIIGNQNATWTNLTGHSSACWDYKGRGALVTQPDGLEYRPYTWEYRCPINASDRITDSDGVERLYLEDFRVRASFTQPSSRCSNVTYWTQRFITIDPDGSGPMSPVVHTFQRRNGTLGTYP